MELKLSEQRRFVLWWKSVERRGGKQSSRPATLADLGVDKHTVERWTARLHDEKKFSQALARAQQKAILTCEFRKGATSRREIERHVDLADNSTPSSSGQRGGEQP